MVAAAENIAELPIKPSLRRITLRSAPRALAQQEVATTQPLAALRLSRRAPGPLSCKPMGAAHQRAGRPRRAALEELEPPQTSTGVLAGRPIHPDRAVAARLAQKALAERVELHRPVATLLRVAAEVEAVRQAE